LYICFYNFVYNELVQFSESVTTYNKLPMLSVSLTLIFENLF
jgi:hypothetical protein